MNMGGGHRSKYVFVVYIACLEWVTVNYTGPYIDTVPRTLTLLSSEVVSHSQVTNLTYDLGQVNLQGKSNSCP